METTNSAGISVKGKVMIISTLPALLYTSTKHERYLQGALHLFRSMPLCVNEKHNIANPKVTNTAPIQSSLRLLVSFRAGSGGMQIYPPMIGTKANPAAR